MLFVFILVVPLPVLSQTPTPPPPISSYEGFEVVLKPTQGANRKVRVAIGERDFSYTHQTGNLFPCREAEPVLIRKVRERGKDVDVYFESERLGSGQIRFETGSDPVIFKELFWHAFGDRTSAIPASPVVGNLKSYFYHLPTCNHLPPAPDRTDFPSSQDAIAASYRKCPLCYKEFPRVREYLLERQLGFQAAAQARILYPPVLDEAKQRRLQGIGHDVLNQWPHPLKGYDYSFTLIESDIPNALAVPGGGIFMTSAFYDMAESDAELEAVLAHEISHVEKRHGYRQYKSARRAAAWAAVGGAILGGVAAAKTKSVAGADAGAQLAIALGQVATALVLSGHAREYEEEADSYASIYFTARGDEEGESALIQSLRKVKYSDELLGRFEDSASALSSHPGIDERIGALQGSVSGMFPEGTVFQGFNKSGKLVGTLELETQRASKNIAGSGANEYALLATVYSTAELGGPCEVKKLRLQSAGKTITLENKEKTEVHPLESVGALFEGTSRTLDLLPAVESVDLNLCSVERWVRVGS